MSATIASTPRPTREPRNGVNTPVLLATINAVKETPALAKFQFRASCRWVDGTYSESRVESFTGAGGEHTHQTQFRYPADHPSRARRPGSWSDTHRIPPARTGRVHYRRHRQHRRGPRCDVDVGGVAGRGRYRSAGILGLSANVRNGYERIRISFTIAGDAPPEKLREIVEQSRARSAVFDVLTNGVPVDVSVTTR